MSYRSAEAGGLHDAVQQTIATLERSRESMASLLAVVGGDGSSIARTASTVREQLAGLQQTAERLAQTEAAAQAVLQESLAEEPLDRQRVTEQINALAEVRAERKGAQYQEHSLQEQLTSLDAYTRSVEESATQLAVALDHSGGAVGLLSSRVRELGLHLESAQQSRALGMHVIRAQEEERRRLAREIHDGPTQLLNSVVLRIDVCQRFFQTDPNRVSDELQQLKELVRLSLQDVRKIIFDLRPMALDDLGLVPALRGFVKDYQAKTGIESDFIVFGNERRYDPALEIAAFRIVQEALTNAQKHAGASRLWVQVETTGGRELKVTVRDDGAGFDPSKIRPGAGGSKFGLVAMRERAELLGGAMEIQSTPGQGTRLMFHFPLGE